MTTAIVEYSPTEAALAELRQKYGATVWVVDTHDRMAGAKKARAEVRKWRTDLEAERKRIKAPALERCQAIDSEARRITSELLAIETPIDDAIKAVEQSRKREEEAKHQAEEMRVAKCRTEIERIRNLPADLAINNATPEVIQETGNALKALDIAWLADMMTEGEETRRVVLDKLRAMYTDAKSREEERARLAHERAKLEADQKAARDRIAEEERQARVVREKADSEARTLRAKADEEARQQYEKLRAERERLDAEHRAEQELKRAEQAKAEALEREQWEKAAERMDARSLLRSFVERYGALEEFATVTAAIVAYLENDGSIAA
jgi:hypothetical protein